MTSWVYEQKTGMLYLNNVGKGRGYSGAKPDGYNNPDLQAVRFVGPIPVGLYTLTTPIDTDSHGPYVLPLIPDSGNTMYGRSGFLVHGDSLSHPGFASMGCIVIDRKTREKIWAGPHTLEVVRVLWKPAASDEETQ